jgi:hypothetical protein
MTYSRFNLDHPDNVSRRARVEAEGALFEELAILRGRLLDVPEYHELKSRHDALINTPLDCGCHCTGWCNGWNPCDRACSTHMCL